MSKTRTTKISPARSSRSLGKFLEKIEQRPWNNGAYLFRTPRAWWGQSYAFRSEMKPWKPWGLKLGSYRGDKLHRPPSSPETNVVGNTNGSSSNLHRRRWVLRWISKSFDIHCPSSSLNHASFLLCWKRCED